MQRPQRLGDGVERTEHQHAVAGMCTGQRGCQGVFHARMAQEKGAFVFDNVVTAICDNDEGVEINCAMVRSGTALIWEHRKELAAGSVSSRVMVDFSHANSNRDFRRQLDVARDVAAQLAAGEDRIIGAMVESHLVEGRQNIEPGKPLERGKSVTDACLGWEDSVALLEILAQGVRERRLAVAGR